MNDQITTRLGEDRRDRLERVITAMNAKDSLRKTNATAIINAGVDRMLDELEAELKAGRDEAPKKKSS